MQAECVRQELVVQQLALFLDSIVELLLMEHVQGLLIVELVLGDRPAVIQVEEFVLDVFLLLILVELLFAEMLQMGHADKLAVEHVLEDRVVLVEVVFLVGDMFVEIIFLSQERLVMGQIWGGILVQVLRDLLQEH